MSGPSPFTVEYDPNALKELAKLDKPIARRILEALDALSSDPRPSEARPLVGYPDLWRIRIGDYRAICTIKDAELVVLALRIAIAAVCIEVFDEQAADLLRKRPAVTCTDTATG